MEISHATEMWQRTTNNKRNQLQEEWNLTGTMSGNWNKERRYKGLREEGSYTFYRGIEIVNRYI